ncbi:MAG: HDOD domain-containing protein [Planctomycetes bacterium]|nr:HDOD domain-containing protein [Planctomycetota bacterium]
MTSAQVLLALFVLFAAAFVVQLLVRGARRAVARVRAGPAPDTKRVKVVRTAPLPRGVPLGARARSAEAAAPAVELGEELVGEIKKELEEIPPVPVVVQRVLAELGDPKSSARTVAEIAQTDPVIAATFLKAINSAYYGLRNPVTSLDQAVALLGYRQIHSLILHYGFARIFPAAGSRKGYRTEDLWVHSLAVSLAGQAIAANLPGVDEGFVATLGLLHDIGKFVIATRYPKRIEKLWAGGAQGDANYLERERALFGADHAAIGAGLARRWKLPDTLIKAIRLHHLPVHPATRSLPEPERRALAVVFIANQLAKYCHAYCEDVEVDEAPPELFEDLGLAGPLESLLSSAVKNAITAAIHFVDQVTPTPLPAVQRLIGVRAAQDLSGIRKVPAEWLTDPVLARIRVGDTPALDLIRQRHSVEIALGTTDFAKIPRETYEGASDVTLAFEPREEKLGEVLAAVGTICETLGWSRERRFPFRFLAKYFLGNILHSGDREGAASLRLRRGLEEDSMEVKSLGLAFRHLVPVDALRETRGEEIAHRVCHALVGAALGRVLTLGWFDRIEASRDGDDVLLMRHAGE